MAQAPAPPPAPGADPAESLPYLEPPEEATLADIIKLAYAAPNPNQKAEIMAELATLKKDPAILKLFRFFVGHAHPRVRVAAEDGLTRMFGDAWKRTAGIKPPVQPPREGE